MTASREFSASLVLLVGRTGRNCQNKQCHPFRAAKLGKCSNSAHAQYKAGVQGTIPDKSGAAIAGAKVTLTNHGTGMQYEVFPVTQG
jgi:hypothetical protein